MIKEQKPILLKIYDGSVSFKDLDNIGYQDACNLYEYAIKINEENTQQLTQLRSRNNVQ